MVPARKIVKRLLRKLCFLHQRKWEREISPFAKDPFLGGEEKEEFPTFFSVSRSQRRFLQIWWLFSFRQGAQSPQLSLRWHPEHSPQRFRFFFVGFSWVSASSPLLKRLLSQGDHHQVVLHHDHHPLSRGMCFKINLLTHNSLLHLY